MQTMKRFLYNLRDSIMRHFRPIGQVFQKRENSHSRKKGSVWMFCSVMSAVIQGLQPEFVQVEVDVSNGLPGFCMVGYLAEEVKEAPGRVRTAIQNIGMIIPPKKIMVNLSPAHVRKRGSGFDLPIAVSVMGALAMIKKEEIKDIMVIGELGLDGEVRKVKGVLPILLAAKEEGYRKCMIPFANLTEGRLADGLEVIGVKSLRDTVEYFRKGIVPNYEKAIKVQSRQERVYDFKDLKGQKVLRRVAEISVSGGHNLLMIGPPGSGKTLTAKCMPGIMPPLQKEEAIELMKIYSIMGLLDEHSTEIERRPFREVHHTISKPALLGGGIIPKPGELSLANGGILFLDELAEFQKTVLETLRQPLEENCVKLIRNSGTYVFPADVILTCAMNACPCGYYPDHKKCNCTPTQIQNYVGKISQAFLERIDLCVETERISYEELVEKKIKEESSLEIQKRICKVRKIQQERFRGSSVRVNAQMNVQQMQKFCVLDLETGKFLKQAYEKLGMSARVYHKILKVARTIADMEEKKQIQIIHVKEALGYRMSDKIFWGE